MTHCYYTSNIIDKCIDVMGLDGYFLIFLMVNINLKIKNYRKKKNKGKTIAIEEFWVNNKTYTLHKFYGYQIGQKERLNANKYCPQQ